MIFEQLNCEDVMSKKNTRSLPRVALAAALAVAGASFAHADTNAARQSVLAGYEAEAKAADPGFSGFDAKRGEAFFTANHAGGKPDTPSCTSCHTTNLKGPGQSKAGKPIEPMAASVNAKRFTDPADVAKWFRRNCNDVLGRECTAAEKGDVLAYLFSL